MQFADPENNLKQFGLSEGQVVADLGAGSGAYAISAARLVGTTGTVYAVEVQKDLVTRVDREARELGLSNLEVRWGDIERVGGTKLRDSSCDVVILSNTLFQVGEMDSLQNEVLRILKPFGRVFIVDWTDSFNGMGPSEESIVSEIYSRGIFENKGFVFLKKISAGAHHYGFSMEKV